MSVTLAYVEDKNGTEASACPREITLNQVVAWNLRWYRLAAGLKQRELGDRLGWSNLAVSEAERSFSGGRVRKFDANELTQISLALSVPLIALLLPPVDDGERERYVFTAPDGEHDMGDLVGLVVMPDSDDDQPAMEAYRDRLRAAVSRYLDPEWAQEVARWLREADGDELLADRAERLRSRQSELLQAADELGDLASAIETGRRRP